MSASGFTAAQHLRSRTGCWTCRFRKKKCDETRPKCGPCSGLRIDCDPAGTDQPLYMKDEQAAKAQRQHIKAQMGKCTRKRKSKNAEAQLLPDFDEAAVHEILRPPDPSSKKLSVLAVRPYSMSDESFSRILQTNIFDAPPNFLDSYLTAMISIDNHQLRLLKHYIYDVCTYTYRGMSGKCLTKIVREALIPRCKMKSQFLQCCLSAGAQHLLTLAKLRGSSTAVGLDHEVVRYQNLALAGLKAELMEQMKEYGVDYPASVENILGYITVLINWAINATQPSWQAHLKHAIACAKKFRYLENPPKSTGADFLIRRLIYVDILSACSLDHIPGLHFQYPAHPSYNLKEATGIADSVLYMISELFYLRHTDPNWPALSELNRHLTDAMPTSQDPKDKLSNAITASYIFAARIALYATMWGVHPHQAPFPGLLHDFIKLLQHDLSPSFDRAVAWPLLVGGSLATRESDRRFFTERLTRGEEICGILRKVGVICKSIWKKRDQGEGEVGWWGWGERETGLLLI